MCYLAKGSDTGILASFACIPAAGGRCVQMHGHQINEFLEREAGAAQNGGSPHALPEVGARARQPGMWRSHASCSWLGLTR